LPADAGPRAGYPDAAIRAGLAADVNWHGQSEARHFTLKGGLGHVEIGRRRFTKHKPGPIGPYSLGLHVALQKRGTVSHDLGMKFYDIAQNGQARNRSAFYDGKSILAFPGEFDSVDYYIRRAMNFPDIALNLYNCNSRTVVGPISKFSRSITFDMNTIPIV